jgi:predicted nucleotidyltransferase
MSFLSDLASWHDETVERVRREFVAAVRHAHASGMSQVDIAHEIRRSQPEVSRLLRFHGTSPRAMALRKHRAEVIRIVGEVGGANVRVFGSVATGEDTDESDIDLLFTVGGRIGPLALAEIERRVSDQLGYDVDLVPDAHLLPPLRRRVLSEAVAL